MLHRAFNEVYTNKLYFYQEIFRGISTQETC